MANKLQGQYLFESIKLDVVTHWDIEYVSSKYGTNVTGSASTHDGRLDDQPTVATRLYDSPIFNGAQGCGWQVLSYVSSNPGEDSPQVIHIYKPIGARKIVIHGYYVTDVGDHVNTSVTCMFTSPQLLYTSVFTSIVLRGESLPQVSEHETPQVYREVGQFRVRSHELQINGSDFCVSRYDYLDPNKALVNSFQVRAIPNLGNIAMTRTFQKFLIGGYKR